MEIVWIFLRIVMFFAVLVFGAALVCFLRIFYLPERARRKVSEEFSLPEGEIYEPFRDAMIDWQKRARKMPHDDVSITSFDGLELKGRYFEYSPDAPIEIIMHGYRGNAERDISGGLFRCFELGHSALLIDHRASGKSQGNITTFGVKESKDCLDWINFIINNINKDAKIIIGGVSMGAATVMLVSAMELPKNVVCVLADCGYTSAEEIIKKVIKDMKLPPNLLFPFVRLGARIFGRFDIDRAKPIEAVKKAKLPIVFFHGATDDFVPYEMSLRNYEACVSQKKIVIIDGAGHGLCYPVDKEKYVMELKEFYQRFLGE